MSSLLADVRSAARRVAGLATSVRIDEDRLACFALELAGEAAEPAQLDPAHHHFGSDARTLAYIITLDAINFGSGWFPVLRKRPGCSGYFTVATALKEHFDRAGAFCAKELQDLDAADCTELFGQDAANSEVAELMAKFATALNDLGALLEAECGGSFEALVEAANHSAERLVRSLTAMPLYRDVTRYVSEDGASEFDVPLYKRAQLTSADIAAAFGGKGYGRFEDLAELTLFADNLVPHVLRCEGVLAYRDDLGDRIDSEQRIEASSREEVEIRAVGLHAVEEMVSALHTAGHEDATAQRLDYVLWNRGQSPWIKAKPRHRARSVFY